MKAISVRENGGPEVLAVEELEVPQPGRGQIRVDVEVAGVNYLDVYHRNGALPAPFVAGVEGIGRVSGVGVGVDSNWIGQRVGWLNAQGSFAETIVLDEAKAVAIPDDIGSDEAVALLMQGVTAHYLTTSAAPITHDSNVLIHAAAGGVGRLLTQIAHHIGAGVIATASSVDKRRIALDAGANHSIGYEDFPQSVSDLTHGMGVDVVYDGVGRDTIDGSVESLAVRGTLVSIGAASGPPHAIEFSTLAARSLSVIRPSVTHFTSRPGELTRRAEEVFAWLREGVVTTTIANRYALDDVAKAQADLASRSFAGKLVVDICTRTVD